MGKKTVDGRRFIYLFSEEPRPRPPPDYELTSISHSIARAGCCGFNHAPYDKKLKYDDEDVPESDPHAPNSRRQKDPGGEYIVRTTVTLLRLGSQTCEFCRILLSGLDQYRQQWTEKWNEFVKYDYQVGHYSDYETTDDPKLKADLQEAVASRPIDEMQIYFRLSCPMEGGFVTGQLSIEPQKDSYNTPNRPFPDRVLLVLEYYTLGGETSFHPVVPAVGLVSIS